MDKGKITLLVIIALLLAIQILDRSREPEQMLAFAERIEESQESLRQQQVEFNIIVEAIKEKGIELTGGGKGEGGHVDPLRDGKPKLYANFLLPHNDGHFNPTYVGGTLKVYQSSPKGLNPIVENSATASDANGYINDSLCSFHPRHPQLWSEGLATSCIISDDYLTYTFYLRDEVYWQVPEIAKKSEFEWLNKKVPLTANDFVATFETVMNPDVECPQKKAYWDDMESVTALANNIVQVKWKVKVYTSLNTSMSISPLPRHIYSFNEKGEEYSKEEYGLAMNKHWFDEMRQAVGVGAYVLDEFTPDKVISFKRNLDYWGRGYHFDRIEWEGLVKDQDPQLVGFKNGDVHAHGLSPTQFKSEVLDRNEPRFAAREVNNPKAGRAGEFAWEQVRSRSYSYIGWNMRSVLFNDKLVRRAMTYAFPKQRIIDEVYYGLGRPQVANVHPDSVYYNPNIKDHVFDLKKAAALLDEAGWKDSNGDGIRDKLINGQKKDFEFTIKYYASSVEWDSTLIIFKNQLREIGVVMTPKSFEWKELLRVYEDKDFEAVSGGWRFGLEVDFVQLWHSKYAEEPRSSNHCGFKNKRADEIAEKLRNTFDQEERIKIAKEFQEIIFEEQPYTFFRSGEGIFIWQNTDKGENNKVLGVEEGLDTYHPLYSREKLLWHLSKE